MPLEHLEDLQSLVALPSDEFTRRRLMQESRRQSRAVTELIRLDSDLTIPQAKKEEISLAEVVPLRQSEPYFTVKALEGILRKLRH